MRPVALATLAKLAQGELKGDPEYTVTGVSELTAAGPEHLCFLSSSEFRHQLKETQAGVVLLHQRDALSCNRHHIICENPYLSYARVSSLFDPHPPAVPGIHPLATVESVEGISDDVSIGPYTVVRAGARIGKGTVVGAGCYIGHDVIIGERNRIDPRVVMMDRTIVGDDCVFLPSCVVGADGFGNAKGPEGWVKLTQLGRVVIGNRVEVGALTAIDCGAVGDTVVHDGVKLDNLIHIAHNCEIGENSAFASGVGVAGSTKIGKDSLFAGKVGVSGHLTLADNIFITGMSMVTRSLTKPGVYSSGLHAMEDSLWKKSQARIHRLDEMAKRLIQLEKQVRQLTSAQSSLASEDVLVGQDDTGTTPSN